MDGIYEEPAVALGFQDWADLTALSGTGFDVVQAVDTGRSLIDRADCGCLDADADGYTADIPRSAVALVYAAAVSVVIVALASAASLLIFASWWTL